MQSQDLEVLSSLADWLDEGRTCHLCTIVATYGSSPRPAGSLLALSDDGGLVGSLSGGCVEDDLVEALRSGEFVDESPKRLSYGVSASDTERLGLPCGGTLSVVVERLEPELTNRATHRAIVETLNTRQCVARTRRLTAGSRPSATAVERFEPVSVDADADGNETLRQVFGPRRQLFLIGAGMVSRYLAEMAQALEYEVTVCDPRQAMLEQWTVPRVRTVCAMPDDAIREHASDARSAIVALTHDPRIDDMALLEALDTPAFYVGAMGSMATSRKRRARLQELGIAPAALARLHAPVGLPIGSKTPAEIAVAILAELTKTTREIEATGGTEPALAHAAPR